MAGDLDPDPRLESLYEWIAKDWETSKSKAREWVDGHLKFLRDHNAMGIKTHPGNLPANSWINKFFYRGRATIIVGPNGQGKTYFASWIMKKAMIFNPEWVFATNIPFYFFDERYSFLRPDNIIQVRSLSETLMLVAENIMQSKETVLVLDETESFSSSHNWRDSNWIAFLNISRHLMVRGPLLTYHATNLIPYELRTGQIGNQIMPLLIHNEERYVASFETKPHALHISSRDTILPYSHLGWGGFRPDVDVIKLERDLVSIDIRKAAELIKKHLDKYILKDRENLIQKEKKEGVELTCSKCGYTWFYNGEKAIARCPNCNHRINLKQLPVVVATDLGARAHDREGE